MVDQVPLRPPSARRAGCYASAVRGGEGQRPCDDEQVLYHRSPSLAGSGWPSRPTSGEARRDLDVRGTGPRPKGAPKCQPDAPVLPATSSVRSDSESGRGSPGGPERQRSGGQLHATAEATGAPSGIVSSDATSASRPPEPGSYPCTVARVVDECSRFAAGTFGSGPLHRYDSLTCGNADRNRPGPTRQVVGSSKPQEVLNSRSTGDHPDPGRLTAGRATRPPSRPPACVANRRAGSPMRHNLRPASPVAVDPWCRWPRLPRRERG
jgi:hypothetical protein